MIIAKWSLSLRVWFSATSNVTMLGRTHQGLFVRFQAVHTRGYLSFFRPYTPGAKCPFLGRTHQGLFVRFCPQTQQGLNVRFCIQTQQGLPVRFSRLYINSQTNCTYHINNSINPISLPSKSSRVFQSSSKIHKITRPIFQMASKTIQQEF